MWLDEEDADWKYSILANMDGNFKADHIEMDNKNDVYLSDGTCYMVGSKNYQKYLDETPGNFEVGSLHIFM